MVPAPSSRTKLLRHAMLRRRVERDDQASKQDTGLGHDESRGWRGFHHHAALRIAAYGLLIAERAASPPSAKRNAPPIQVVVIPAACRPRGAPDPA